MKQAKRFPFLKIQQQRLQLNIDNQSQCTIPAQSDIFRWVWQALKNDYAKARINIIFLDKEEAEAYNRQYRDKDYATNILSFPYENEFCSGRPILQGDLLLCPQIVEKEAAEQQKNLDAHYAHLIIHGVLHLIGYDHEEENTANQMESLEITLLHQLGYQNPYDNEA